ncbi:phosphotransferase [Candidatus Uhrbacteria bacterium]|nr:phosphotransferase [Candidatus Uhrbacteria bacterium]
MKNDIPKAVLNSYDIGNIQDVKVVTDGLVHKTYTVKTATGNYILQKLHPVLASKAIGRDFLFVTRFLTQEGFPTPQAVLSKKGDVVVKVGNDAWRMQTKLKGKTVHVLKDLKMARACGEIYAQFHKVMDGFPYKFTSTKILHETEKVYATFLNAVKKGMPEEVAQVQEEIDFLTTMLPTYFLPGDVPMRVIHGDPKISNILFDLNGQAKAIIDLDTCNRRPLLVELGDAFRSWCGGREDDLANRFSLPIFRASWLGYKKGATDMMTKQELQYVPQSIGTITLELACRFMTDYFEDNYFGWDPARYESRREHNLARARGQISEFMDYQKKLPAIKKIVGVK